MEELQGIINRLYDIEHELRHLLAPTLERLGEEHPDILRRADARSMNAIRLHLLALTLALDEAKNGDER